MGFDATGGKPFKAETNNLYYAMVGVVVLVAFAFVMWGPAWLKALSGDTPRPIAEIVAGLDKDAAAAALHEDAFPDPLSRAFMDRLREKHPSAHADLTASLADAAFSGATRDDLTGVVGAWSVAFAQRNAKYIARSDAVYFDQALYLGAEALQTLRQAGGETCQVEALRSVVSDPAGLAALSAYDGAFYQLGLKGNILLMDLVESGRTNPQSYRTPSKSDEIALQNLMVSMMGDPDVMKIVQAGMSQDPSALGDMDVCALGERVLAKVGELPASTKQAVWGAMMSGAQDKLS